MRERTRFLARTAIAAASAAGPCALVPALALAQVCCSIASAPLSDPTHMVAPGTPVTLTATCLQNPTTYSWATGATTQSIVVAPVTGTQYFFSGTNSAGVCTISYFVNVTNATSPAAARTTGSFLATSTHGGYVKASFSCVGQPTCTGTYSGEALDEGCSNSIAIAGNITVTGLDLSHAGTIQGAFTLANGYSSNGSPVCTYVLNQPPFALPFAATWNGTAGAIAFSGPDNGGTYQITGGFTSDISAAPPAFPMTVASSVTSTNANVAAQIQPRTQDIGTSRSIFVFAHAPSNLVSGTLPTKRRASVTPEDGAIVCVLAQVDANGHLTAVSASTMQAYLTGVLTSQSQSVQILNNVATPNVAGASMFVGYGSSAASMLASGVFQSVVNVPGAVQCTASLASAPAAATPAALSGLWWNANESGWGIHFTQRGLNLFAAWYTYDAQGNPKWYVAPNCPFSSSNAVAGSCTSSLYEVDGPTFFGVAFKMPTPDQVKAVGTLQLSFQNTNAASMTYTVGSQSRTVAIVRQVFDVPATSPPAVDFTDLWWNPSESGWGMAMAHQFGNVFLAWYVYDATGKPFWYVAPSCTVSGSSCSGALYRTTGPAFGPPLDPNQVHPFAVGSAIVSFVDANNAVLSYTVDGVNATKVITRQLF